MTIFCVCNKKNCLNVKHFVALSLHKGRLLQSLGFDHIEKPVEELSKMKRLHSLLERGKQCNEMHEDDTKICDCLLWSGYCNDRGYGTTEGGSVHRIRWKLEHGEIPKNLQTRHKCKYHKNCFNIDYLELGTSAENANDKIRDATNPVGERNPSVKITNEVAKEIRNSKNNKDLSVKERAKMFGVSKCTMHKIDCNLTWPPENETVKIRKRESYERQKNKIPTMEDYEKIWIRIQSKCMESETSTYEGTNCLEYKNSNEKYKPIYFVGRLKYPHQIAWIKFYGDDLNLLHKSVYRKCGNLSCVNPEHLITGDTTTISGIKRKRGVVMGKISETEAIEIYELKEKMSQVDIAKKYGISAFHVSKILRKKQHKYLHE